jgi:hypothetical protein
MRLENGDDLNATHVKAVHNPVAPLHDLPEAGLGLLPEPASAARKSRERVPSPYEGFDESRGGRRPFVRLNHPFGSLGPRQQQVAAAEVQQAAAMAKEIVPDDVFIDGKRNQNFDFDPSTGRITQWVDPVYVVTPESLAWIRAHLGPPRKN